MQTVIFLGAGEMAEVRAKAFLATDQVEIGYFLSRSLTRAAQLADKFKVGGKGRLVDLDIVLGLYPADIVVIELPHKAQDEYLERLLSSEHCPKKILIGGPFASNFSTARRQINRLNTLPCIVEGGIEGKYNPLWIEAKRQLDNLGEISKIETTAHWNPPTGTNRTWYTHKESGGLVVTHMTYCFISLIHFLGIEILGVTNANARKRKKVRDDEIDHDHYIVDFKCQRNGREFNLKMTASYHRKGNNPEDWCAKIYGENETLSVYPDEKGPGELILRKNSKKKRKRYEPNCDSLAPFVAQAEALLVADGKDSERLLNKPSDCIMDMKIVDWVDNAITMKNILSMVSYTACVLTIAAAACLIVVWSYQRYLSSWGLASDAGQPKLSDSLSEGWSWLFQANDIIPSNQSETSLQLDL